MKIKSKLILAATSLLVLSGVAAGTSTFAWFTANQAATITASTISVDADIDELQIAVSPDDASSFTADTDGLTTRKTFTGGVDTLLTDVSGNGLEFFKGTTDVDGNYSNSSTLITDNSAPTSFTFTVTFTRTNTANDLAIFLSNTSSVTPNDGLTTGADTNLANSTRVAIISGDTSSSLAYYAPNEASVSGLESILVDAANTAAVAPDAANLELTDNTQNILTAGNFGSITDYNDSDGVAAKNEGLTNYTSTNLGYIDTIASGETTLQIKVRLWLEGQDADCDNNAKGGKIDANFIFNGVSEVYEA